MNFLDKINAITLSELLGATIVYLVERPTLDFAGLLRAEKLLTTEELEVLDRVICLKVFLVLSRDSDADALKLEIDALRRLVPHDRRDKLNNYWLTRWLGFSDLLELAVYSLSFKSNLQLKDAVLEIPVCKKLLDLIKENPGSCESDLSDKLQIEEKYLKGYLRSLEGNGLIRLSVRGAKKFVYPLDKA